MSFIRTSSKLWMWSPTASFSLKLERDGFVKWIRKWLVDGMQRVVINGSESEWTPGASGVLQGSLLGPLSFNVFIKLNRRIEATRSKFADDIKLSGMVIRPEGGLPEDPNKMEKWVHGDLMCFNKAMLKACSRCCTWVGATPGTNTGWA